LAAKRVTPNSQELIDSSFHDTEERSAPERPPRAFADHVSDQHDLAAAQALQSQRMESLGQLAGGIAHDFNNLLAVILNYSAFVTEELATSTESLESARSDLGEISLAAERASKLTRQLLAFARREVIQPQVIN